jgi:predicted dehydrogenase
MHRKAKIGMIGLRGWGNVVRKALLQCQNLELVAIWSRDPESIARAQRELPCKACETYEALLAEPIDAVLIVNPNYLHFEYCMSAARANKHVLVEKPMTNTVAEGKQLVDEFKKRGLLLCVKHMHRFSPPMRKLREMVENGTFGKILSVETYTSHSSSKNFPPDRWKRDPKLCPAAPLTQLGVHYIDTVMSFLGKPEWVQSEHRNILKLSENVDCTVTMIGYEKAVATFHAHYVVPAYSRIAVYGTEGIGLFEEGGQLRFKKEGGKDFEIVPVPPGDGLVAALDEFGETLLTGKPYETPGEVALLVVAAAEAAIKSAAENGRRVSLSEVM